MDEAAREAAGTEIPAFLDDDDEPKPYGAASAYGAGYGSSGGYGTQGDWSSSGAGAGGGGYSDTASHGTYAQPPMSHESYPMHDFAPAHNPGVGVGGIYDASAFAGGAAAAGAMHHAMNDNGSRSNGSNTAIGDSPYPAFLQPGAYEGNGGGVGPGGYPPMGRGAGYDKDVIAGGAAGMAGIGRRSSMNTAAVNRMKSQSSALSDSGSTVPPSYVSGYAPAVPSLPEQNTLNRNPSGHSQEAPVFNAGGANFSSAVHDAAFGNQSEQPPLPNPFSARLESEENADGGAEDPYGGYGSEEEEEQPRKVLKVANE
ncbi:hypothetical protein C8R42DRAFT_340114 [Lentinula raphanica]|nr:hypothetical protein C8R42DRAFT_340114 [Lentinula raphanica]